MISAKDIIDEDSLKQWLEEWPASQGMDEEAARKVAVTIAHRITIRIFPNAWKYFASKAALKRNLTAMPILRSNLILGVASKYPNAEIKSAALAFATAFSVRASSVTAVIVADASAAAAGYAFSASGPSADIWGQIQDDAAMIEKGEDISLKTLWSQAPPDRLQANEMVMLEAWRDDAPTWDFWARWWDGAQKGEPLDWALQEKVALIPDADWEQGPEHIAGVIRGIEEALKPKAEIISLRDYFNATLFDFSFDKIEGVMRAIPMADDWKHLSDPDRVKSFLTDADDLKEDLDLLCNALSAEGGAMQGAGAVRTYMQQVLRELENAGSLGTLRVGKLLEYGRILESASQKDEVLLEFGVLGEPFKMSISKLRELVRDHFSYTLSRMEVLRSIRMDAEDDPRDVLLEFRAIVDAVKSGANGALPKLAVEDAAVLADVLDSVDGQIRALDVSTNEDNRSSIKREIDFQLAKVGATAGIYTEKAAKAVGKGNDTSDVLIKAHKRFEGLRGIGRAIRDGFDFFG
jgi:hypothetical protein